MKTYVFRVVVEPDEDRWSALCPALEEYAAATWGYTKEGALHNIREVIEMILEELLEDNISIPEEPSNELFASTEPRVAVTI